MYPWSGTQDNGKHASWTAKRKSLKNEDRLRDLLDKTSQTNIHMIGIPKEEKREKGIENLFEEMIAENIPNIGKEIGI